MKEKTLQMESFTCQFLIDKDQWQLKLAKSQTRVKDIRQLALINETSDLFVPAAIEEEEDFFAFSFFVNERAKTWEDVCQLNRNDKLRLLCNLARFKKCLTTRITFFLHPDNLIFDDNLIPSLVYRGIRDLVPPYEIHEEKFLLQYKCLIVALFSKKYSFDELYSGSLKNARENEFERKVAGIEDFDSLVEFLRDNYIQEEKETEKYMQIVPKKRFRLFKQTAFSMIALSVLLAIPLIYFSFIKIPFQGHLLQADSYFLSQDYSNVINELEGKKPESLPNSSKYVLAYAYIKSEKLSEDQINAVLKNISLKSDPNYLLYWIYNGRGDFNKSLDLAKYIDDPRLIMYGLIQQMQKVKNDPQLSGSQREEKLQSYMDQYNTYKKKYGLDSLLNSDPAQPANAAEQNQAGTLTGPDTNTQTQASQPASKQANPKDQQSGKNEAKKASGK